MIGKLIAEKATKRCREKGCDRYGSHASDTKPMACADCIEWSCVVYGEVQEEAGELVEDVREVSR